jgi:DNA-binding NtrC family response regulator
VVKLQIPPLRERKEDILPLFRFFLNRFNERFKKGFVQISREAEDRILSYPWLGNIRELRNAIERILLLEKGDTILGKHLSFLSEVTKTSWKGSAIETPFSVSGNCFRGGREALY